MIRLITYDITVDKSRTKIAKRLEVLGLERIQQSVFLGPMDATGLRAFLAWADKLLDPDDRLYAWQLDQDQARDMVSLGQRPDLALILGEKAVLFF